MSCTTILVGRKATYDGSTFIARNDDSPSGKYTPKKFTVVHPEEQPRKYRSVLSHVEIDLPDNPMRYTAVPNALEGEGIWAASGVNEANVAMTATETITTNERVLGADPLVEFVPATDGRPEVPGGIGEEDLVVLTLPYIHTAREGVARMGNLLEKYGTYESNGMAFQDKDEIWWLESIGGHHWIARRVPDDRYVIMPNQLGIDEFDMDDAFGEQKNYMCSADLREFITWNHLDLTVKDEAQDFEVGFSRSSGDSPSQPDTASSSGTHATKHWTFNPRDAFGSHDDADHVYNTPRGWYMARYLNPHFASWDGPHADYRPDSDDIPWSLTPERKVTPEDVKYLLSSHYQGTPYDPYASYGDSSRRGAYRSIGINRNDFLALIQIRPYQPEEFRTIEWLAFASNAFNTWAPMYANVTRTPAYLSNTGKHASTDNFYWTSRMIAAMTDASYGKSLFHIERYQLAVGAKGHELIRKYDAKMMDALGDPVAAIPATASSSDRSERNDRIHALAEQANQEMADALKEAAADTLDKVLYELSNQMKNSYSRSDT